jgi:hypothetical protein
MKTKGPCALVKEAVTMLKGSKGTRDEIIEQARAMTHGNVDLKALEVAVSKYLTVQPTQISLTPEALK